MSDFIQTSSQVVPGFNLHFGLDNDLLNGEELRRNIEAIERDVSVAEYLFSKRIAQQPNSTFPDEVFSEIIWPELNPTDGPYSSTILSLNLLPEERLLLLLTLMPHFAQDKLDSFIESTRHKFALKIKAIGGYILPYSNRFRPSLQTVIFLCGGYDRTTCSAYSATLQLKSKLFYLQILTRETFSHNQTFAGETWLDEIPMLTPEYIYHLLYGREVRPDFGENFPAKYITTDRNWSDLLITPVLRNELFVLEMYLQKGSEYSKTIGPHYRKGFCVLFTGGSGTGKTLTAKLLGKKYGRNVFRVELAQIMDKYIGETEKKLAALFDRMELYPGSILFFDEADVLFAKRTAVRDSKDRWANLLTAYLLQRIENYEGLCILATNLRNSIDFAMARRFDISMHFENPRNNNRLLVWKKALPDGWSFSPAITEDQLAGYEFTAANVENIMKLCTLSGSFENIRIIHPEVLNYFVSHEYGKQGLTPPHSKDAIRKGKRFTQDIIPNP